MVTGTPREFVIRCLTTFVWELLVIFILRTGGLAGKLLTLKKITAKLNINK